MEKGKKVFGHDHPLTLTDLWLEQLQHEAEEEEEEEDKEEEEEENDKLIANQDFQCWCSRCHEEIRWYHRYYYSCSQCSDYTIHKFCAELQEEVEDICEVGHKLRFGKSRNNETNCDKCGRLIKAKELFYYCHDCFFIVDVNCVTKRLQKNTIYHPSHKHPQVCIPKQILDKCDACGKEHKGMFYHCITCANSSFIHSDCAFLPKKLQIQHTTNDFFSHIHPLTLAYSFPYKERQSKNWPRCRVCFSGYFYSDLWIYECEKCRYYTHLACATSRNEPFMSILASRGGKTFKNYEDSQHPDLLHLPFLDPSYSILQHLFFKEDIGSSTSKTQNNIIHQHPLILVDARCTDITSIPTSSRIKPISYHDPMKRIELLCDVCVRPIMSGPIYMCANEEKDHCNFVLHEWCSTLPTELKDHPGHTQHSLILHSRIPGKFFGVFNCDICKLPCNGFAYYCEECNYCIDVKCAFLPKEITHNSHPNHLLSRKFHGHGGWCGMCSGFINGFSFDCHICNDFHLHPNCALLIPETTMNKCDKHPMKLSYFPIENHKSDYFCEVCEMEFDPEFSFYHCRECMQSMHTACAPSILRYETYTTYQGWLNDERNVIYKFVNVKFVGTYKNIKVHPHPLSFLQGIANDGQCASASHNYNYQRDLQYNMIFKCLTCEFALHYKCCERMISS